MDTCTLGSPGRRQGRSPPTPTPQDQAPGERGHERVPAPQPLTGLGPEPLLPGGSPAAPASSMEDASEVIRRAKQDLERLKKKEIRQRRKR